MRTVLAGRRSRVDWPVVAVVAAVAGAAWVAVVVGVGGGPGLAGFTAAWAVMMVAMMLPSAAPLLLLYRRGAAAVTTTVLAAGYLAVWAGTGVAAYALERWAMDAPRWLLLAGAGAYQLTPAKGACLRRCRTPADFLVERWRSSAFLLGADHGLFCVGCCWALMAVLVVAGMMGIAWVIVVAAVVAAEKLSSRGEALARSTGIALLGLAVWEGVSWAGS